MQQILLFFGKKKHLHNPIYIRTYTFIIFLRFFLQNLIFTYINEKKSFLHRLIKGGFKSENFLDCFLESQKIFELADGLGIRQEIFSEFNNRVGLNKLVGRISPQN